MFLAFLVAAIRVSLLFSVPSRVKVIMDPGGRSLLLERWYRNWCRFEWISSGALSSCTPFTGKYGRFGWDGGWTEVRVSSFS